MVIKKTCDLNNPLVNKSRVVIIGGGTVGLYAAHELLKQGKDVVVIESGGETLNNFTPSSFSSIGKNHEGIRIGRSKSLGGTSNLWGGQLVEFQPVDFIGREWLPDSSWPITFEEVAAYHQTTYENLGITSEFTDDGLILSDSGIEKSTFSNGVELFLTRWLKIPSMAVAYATEINTSDHLQVLLDHSVVGFDYSGELITGLQISNLQGEKFSIQGDTFILASGTIEMVRLLLHTASLKEELCPWKSNQNIGLYFQDHLVGRVASVEIKDKKRFFNIFSTIVKSGQKFQPKLRLSDSALRSERILNIHGMMSFESSVSENLVYLKQFLKAALYSRKISGFLDLLNNLKACWKHLIPLMWKYVVENRVFVPSTSKVSFNIQSEQSPMIESRITIDPSVKDVSGLPKVVIDWQVGDEELPSILKFTERINGELKNAGLAELRIEKNLLNKDPEFMEHFRDNYHQVGGVRIGFTEKDGVVDKNLKVFGTSNLYAIGAGTFRTSSNANTTFTALTFVTRLVDQLNS